MKVDGDKLDKIYKRDIGRYLTPRRKLSHTNVLATITGALIGIALILLVASGVMNYSVLLWIIGLVGLAIVVYALRGRKTW